MINLKHVTCPQCGTINLFGKVQECVCGSDLSKAFIDYQKWEEQPKLCSNCIALKLNDTLHTVCRMCVNYNNHIKRPFVAKVIAS